MVTFIDTTNCSKLKITRVHHTISNIKDKLLVVDLGPDFPLPSEQLHDRVPHALQNLLVHGLERTRVAEKDLLVHGELVLGGNLPQQDGNVLQRKIRSHVDPLVKQIVQRVLQRDLVVADRGQYLTVVQTKQRVFQQCDRFLDQANLAGTSECLHQNLLQVDIVRVEEPLANQLPLVDSAVLDHDARRLEQVVLGELERRRRSFDENLAEHALLILDAGGHAQTAGPLDQQGRDQRVPRVGRLGEVVFVLFRYEKFEKVLKKSDRVSLERLIFNG